DARVRGPAYRARDSVAAAAERDTLLRTLASIADRLPGDEWAIGQRIYYLVAAGRTVDALRAVAACRAAAAWCELLGAYIHERGGRIDAAQVSAENALRLMTPPSQCAWLDVGPLLSTGMRAAYDGMSCETGERRAFGSRFWWLADPSWLTPGNDR